MNESSAMYAENLMYSIVRIIEKYNAKVDCRLEYGGSAILIEDRYDTRFWLRVSDWRDGKIRVDFSTVELRYGLRRKGVFSEICDMVKRKEYVGSAVISNVCTEEMLNFCKKHKFRYNEMMNNYQIK